MKYNLLDDISTVSRIKPLYLQKLCSLAKYCICDYIYESLHTDEEIVELNVGIGTLSIMVDDDCIKYQFKPSSSLEKNIVSTVENRKNPMTADIEGCLESKMLNTFKELF